MHRPHDERGPARRARPLRALVAGSVRALARTRVNLLQRLVTTTIGAITLRQAHRGSLCGSSLTVPIVARMTPQTADLGRRVALLFGSDRLPGRILGGPRPTLTLPLS